MLDFHATAQGLNMILLYIFVLKILIQNKTIRTDNDIETFGWPI